MTQFNRTHVPRALWAVLAAFLAVLLLVGVYFLPPVQSRVGWRVQSFFSRVYYALYPPDQAVFVPQKQVIAPPTPPVGAPDRSSSGASSGAALQPSLTPSPMPGITPSPVPSVTPAADFTDATPLPGASPTALPTAVTLKGIVHEYQSFNNCGPANLSMLLRFWGWQGDQRTTRAALRPNEDDANVMPEELLTYAQAQPGLGALLRVDGDLPTLRRLLAAGLPVIVETGHTLSGDWWLGHYVLLSGYDDARSVFITQDSLIMADLPVPYADLEDRNWRDFNFTYLVAYPLARQGDVLTLLGEDADPTANLRRALQRAEQESQTLQGRDRFFALYNLGSSALALGEDARAATAFDDAYAEYAKLEDKQRPWRITWYRTGAYEAYYRTARYTDVINLANSTLSWLSKRGLEESHYWRGMVYEATGEKAKAQEDYEIALKLRPGFALAQAGLERVTQPDRK